ncbi:MAG: hypothetical protein EBV06_10455 [Planctomycetia bacterium]|nr:hypothetical protein [Planctomycetia bacterium]
MNETMRSVLEFVKAGSLVTFVCISVWGCSKPAVSTTQERVRALESRCVQLEQDYRTVAQARDRARTDLAQAQEQLISLTKLQGELGDLKSKFRAATTEGEMIRKMLAQRTQERDDLRQQMTVRMNEREVLITRCDKLRKGLQSLLSQDDSSVEIIPASGN